MLRGTISRISTKLDQFLIISFSGTARADRRTNGYTHTDAKYANENNTLLRRCAGPHDDNKIQFNSILF